MADATPAAPTRPAGRAPAFEGRPRRWEKPLRKRSQVIIVGAGPVGVGLAVDLGLRGISCTLVERRVGMHKIPKGQNLAQRTLERFYFWGCVDELRAERILPPEVPAAGVTAYKNLMSEHW